MGDAQKGHLRLHLQWQEHAFPYFLKFAQYWFHLRISNDFIHKSLVQELSRRRLGIPFLLRRLQEPRIRGVGTWTKLTAEVAACRTTAAGVPPATWQGQVELAVMIVTAFASLYHCVAYKEDGAQDCPSCHVYRVAAPGQCLSWRLRVLMT